MSTDKVSLGGVRISPDILDRLKELYKTEARRRASTGNKITFSSWIEELLAYYASRQVIYRRAMDRFDELPNDEFE